jgi:hypothetical protein
MQPSTVRTMTNNGMECSCNPQLRRGHSVALVELRTLDIIT